MYEWILMRKDSRFAHMNVLVEQRKDKEKIAIEMFETVLE